MATVMASISQSALDARHRTWERRISRARELQEQHPATAPVLSFYQKVLEFQRDIAIASKSSFSASRPLREQIDLPFAATRMPAILSLAIKSGPEALATSAKSLQEAGEAQWNELSRNAVLRTEFGSDFSGDFFARACLQPISENLRSQLPIDPNYSQNTCPACGGIPQAAVLRPEGDGGRRWLLCSFCLGEWLFRRVLCPWCGEQDKEKLPRYSADECTYVRVEGCDTCKRYLKGIDLTIDGRAVPLVDEVALAVLDVWAAEHGYTKINRNLMGF
jgi:FdhE protein